MENRLTIRTDICVEPENDIVYYNPSDPEGMYNIFDLANCSECGDGTESEILLDISERLAEYEDTGLTPAEVAELAQAKADGRVVVLDEPMALSMCAGARAIETSNKFYGSIYAYDIFGNQREIPYKVAAQKLREEAEKALKECESE